MAVTFITGPVRSGKSRFAERLARERALPVVYFATARRDEQDAEWSARIAHHRARRPGDWHTVETEALAPGDLLALLRASRDAVVFDSLGTWLAAEMTRAFEAGEGDAETRLDERALESAGAALVEALLAPSAHVFVVGEETGWGLVPVHRSGRIFRDVLGRLQQRLAAAAETSYLVVDGFAIDLRRTGMPIDEERTGALA